MKAHLALAFVIIVTGSLAGGCAHKDEWLCGGSFKSTTALKRAWPNIPDPGPNPHTARY